MRCSAFVLLVFLAIANLGCGSKPAATLTPEMAPTAESRAACAHIARDIELVREYPEQRINMHANLLVLLVDARALGEDLDSICGNGCDSETAQEVARRKEGLNFFISYARAAMKQEGFDADVPVNDHIRDNAEQLWAFLDKMDQSRPSGPLAANNY